MKFEIKMNCFTASDKDSKSYVFGYNGKLYVKAKNEEEAMYVAKQFARNEMNLKQPTILKMKRLQ